MTLAICFERLDWSLAVGYLVSTTPTLQLLIETLNVKKNYQIKWYGQERRRGTKWVSLQFTVLLKLFIHIAFANSLWKKELVVLFQIPCSCRGSLVVNRLWEFSVTKPTCYTNVFVNSFCSPTCGLWNSLVIEPFLWLII